MNDKETVLDIVRALRIKAKELNDNTISKIFNNYADRLELARANDLEQLIEFMNNYQKNGIS